MTTHQKQQFCNHCQELQLFTADEKQPNHVAHLLVCLFCCGIWLPVWILIAILPNARNPFHCRKCGLGEGYLSESQIALRQQHELENATRLNEQRQAKREQKAEDKQQKQQERQESWKTFVANIRSTISGVPKQIDYGIRAWVGDDNETLVTLYKGLLLGFLIILLLAMGFGLGRLILSFQ